ncbi:MAG: SHOCT domain-containing protein, partial [Actinomycetota bacterium]
SAMGVVAGIGVLILALSSGILSQAPGGFGFFFVLIAIGAIIVSAINAFSAKGVADELIEFETEPGETAEDRLSELSDLRDRGLVTEEEYREKRKEILSGL